ncbi:MAG: arylsulfatase, partial [Verrucomicrobiae bacterium]|nr:arylsulfatase [Verrucomicrobiae bacterium]
LAWAPGLIPGGTVSDEITTSMDVLPTFAKLSGAKVPSDRIIDGKNILPILKGEPGARTPHESFFYYRGNLLYAVRSGPWKLFVRDYPPENAAAADGTLFNLEEDIGETTDVSSHHPDVVARLRKLAEACRADIGDGPGNPGANRRKAAYIDLDEAVTLTTR